MVAGPGNRLTATLEFETDRIGLASPPTKIHARVLRSHRGWTLLVTFPPAFDDEVVAWMESFRPDRVLRRSTQPPTVASALFLELPPAWHILTDGVVLRDIVLDADGSARARVEGPRDRMEALAARVGQGAPAVLQDLEPTLPARPLLTQRQDEALRRAVEEGYYEVPRRVNLRELAKQAGRSPAALSELLRRAEARVVSEHIRRNTPAGDAPSVAEPEFEPITADRVVHPAPRNPKL